MIAGIKQSIHCWVKTQPTKPTPVGWNLFQQIIPKKPNPVGWNLFQQIIPKKTNPVGWNLCQQNELKKSNNRYIQQGFTLIELVMVIVLLGVIAVGISGFIRLSTQTYVNVADRDELIASARFAIERLNRELRNAVPNSIRTITNGSTPATIQCIEFTPIIASTHYLDIPVAPEPASTNITVVPFLGEDGVNDYSCTGFCLDSVTVYPLTSADIYSDTTDDVGKVFPINNFSPPAGVNTEWTISLAGAGKRFDDDSPTGRLYIIRQPVSYCVNNGELIRYVNYGSKINQLYLPTSENSVMAEHLDTIANSGLPFTYTAASLQRNALTEIKLQFVLNGEKIVFNQTIHSQNIP